MSQDVLQQRIDQILEKCLGTHGIADDIALYGKTKLEHDKQLDNLIKVARDNGFVFNSKKCVKGQERIHFFSMVYDAKGVHPDPERVEDIRNTPAPTNKICLQQFLGIATYRCPFVPQLAELTAPLRDLMNQDVDFQWNASLLRPEQGDHYSGRRIIKRTRISAAPRQQTSGVHQQVVD